MNPMQQPFMSLVGSLITSFTISRPINPGASLQFSWNVSDSNAVPVLAGWGPVTAVLSFQQNTLYTSAALTPSSSGRGGSSVGQSDVSVAISAAAPYAKELYSLGSHDLSLTITGSVALNTITRHADLKVIPESLGPLVWLWDVANSSPNWNQPYALAGNFLNLSENSAMTVTFQLYETDETDNTPAIPRGGSTLTVPINQETFWTSSVITQNWGWLDCPSGLAIHDTIKQFNYQMQMQVTDAWGNSYSFPQFSTIYREVVGVPDYKMLNAGVAATAFGVALGAAAGGAISGPFTFGIGAAIGGGVAATAMTSPRDFAMLRKIHLFQI